MKEMGDLIDYIDGCYAVFTGTPGVDRKLVVYAEKLKLELSSKLQRNIFIKISLNRNSETLLSNEHFSLGVLSKLGPLDFEFPSSYFVRDSALIISSCKYRRNIRISKYNQNQRIKSYQYIFNTLNRVYSNTATEISFSKYIEASVNVFIKTNSIFNEKGIELDTRTWIHESVSANSLSNICMKIGMVHGDLTPWNVCLCDRNLFVFDWERSRSQESALFDLLYLFLSVEILVIKNHSVDKLSKVMDMLLESMFVREKMYTKQLSIIILLKLLVDKYELKELSIERFPQQEWYIDTLIQLILFRCRITL